MDPLSIVRSSLSVAGALTVTLEQVQALCNAHGDVLGLINEVSDLRLILTEIDNVIQKRNDDGRVDAGHVQGITAVLQRAQANLEHLDRLLENGVTEVDSTNGKRKIKRFAWMKQKTKLKRLEMHLKDTRITLSTLVTNATLLVSGRPT